VTLCIAPERSVEVDTVVIVGVCVGELGEGEGNGVGSREDVKVSSGKVKLN